jgi:hypothetical protein
MLSPIVNKLRDRLHKAMAGPEHVKKLEDQGIAMKIMVCDHLFRGLPCASHRERLPSEFLKASVAPGPSFT